MKIFESTPLTLIDQTDSRKLEVYIKSNLPTSQIYNQNTGAYTPDWREGEKLTISMDVFLDSRTMTTSEYNGTSIKWYKNDIEMVGDSTESLAANKRTLTINDNILRDTPIITYTCEVAYQNVSASSRITFVKVDTGLNGAKGDDGTSIKILGTAKSVTQVADSNYYTITYSEGSVVAAALGDSYVYQGDLYVCSVLDGSGTNDYFVNVGPIQGEPGEPAKSIVLIGSAQVFKVGKDGESISPKTVTITAHTVNINNKTDIGWQYRYNSALAWTDISGEIKDTAGNVIISLNGDNDIATVNVQYLNNYTSIALRAICDDAEDVLTLYKVFDGIDGQKGDTASMAFLTNENTSFPASADGKTNVLTTFRTNVVAYNGTEKATPTIGAIGNLPSGMSVMPNKGTAYAKTVGDSIISDLYSDKDMKSIINKLSLVNGDSFVVGDYLYKYNSTSQNFGLDSTIGRIVTNNEITLLFSVPTGKNLGRDGNAVGEITIPVTSPVSTNLLLSWTKINAGPEGEAGVGIEKIDVDYGSSKTSTVKMEEIEWSDTIPVVPEGEYLWTRTTINYTDPEKQDTVTYTYVQQGKKGDTGTFVDDADIQYAAGSNATTPPSSGWSTAVVGTTTDKQYLWTRTIFKLSDGTAGDPVYSVAKQGQDGKDGTGASLVDVTPSTMYFKSTTGSAGPFEPQYIYLYPRFQNATYSNWQYSIDGGTTWKNVISGSDWLLIDTFNSIPNALRIERGSKLYTNEVTSISFKCNSTTAGVYDTVSIAKIYDVADLQIGGRNLVLNSNVPVTKSEYLVHSYKMSEDWEIGTTYTLTLKGSIGSGQKFGIWANGSSTRVAELMYDSTKGLYVSTFIPTAITTQRIKELNVYNTPSATMGEASIEWIKLEKSNTPSDWSPAPEDLVEEAANVNVMLSNEAHFFEATAGGVPIDTSVTLDVVGYKGSVKSATTVGTISGIPSAGMTATITNNGTTNTKLTITVTSALTSDIADYGILTIPITVNGHTINKIFNWTKAKAGDVGASGSDAVTFQVYSNNGYALSTSVPALTLQTFAYVGDVEIKAGATYQWYRHNNTGWVAVSGATNDYFNVSRDDVSFSNNYMCKMLFSGAEYVGVVTIEDKNDENKVFASKPFNYFAGDLWIVGTDYTPPGYTVGTMLRAEHTNTGYTNGDWVLATKYDDEINELKDTVNSYKQYFSVNSANGLQIGNSSINNDILTTNHINTSTIDAISANVESLDVVGKYSGSTMLQAPIINLGNFSLVIESNGSLSIVANT